MKTLDALVSYLASREDVKMFQSLEKTVRNNPAYKAAYEDVLTLQKQWVKAKHNGLSHNQTIEKAYKNALKALQDTPAVAQYLVLQDELNTLLYQITQLIEAALSEPFNHQR